MDSYQTLIEHLIEEGVLRTKRIIEAFRKIHRRDFLPPSLQGQEGIDAPLPLGYGQTISQPYTVAFMFELLQPQKGHKVMDIGYGSGWTTALLAYIVSQEVDSKEKTKNSKLRKKGQVYAVEIVPELCKLGRANIKKYDFIKEGIMKTFCQDGSKGLPTYAPFDRIIAAASSATLPPAWLSQLSVDGRLEAPIGESIFLYKRTPAGIEKKEFPGFLFVPLISKKPWVSLL